MELNLKLNARLQPIDRFDLEDALQETMEKHQMGQITGGGTGQNPDGEIAYCDIAISLMDGPENIEWLVQLLNAIGIAKGSVLSTPETEIPVGTLEGLACYSNGRELPDEVYQNCDINYVVEQMEESMEGIGRLYSYWEGDVYTALYFYGTSFDEMKCRIEPFTATYPLCQKSRIERIA